MTDKQKFPRHSRVSQKPDPNNKGFVHVTTHSHRHSLLSFSSVRLELEAKPRSYVGQAPNFEKRRQDSDYGPSYVQNSDVNARRSF